MDQTEKGKADVEGKVEETMVGRKGEVGQGGRYRLQLK